MPEKNQITELLSSLKAGDAILSKQGNKHIFYILLHKEEKKFYWGFTDDPARNPVFTFSQNPLTVNEQGLLIDSKQNLFQPLNKELQTASKNRGQYIFPQAASGAAERFNWRQQNCQSEISVEKFRQLAKELLPLNTELIEILYDPLISKNADKAKLISQKLSKLRGQKRLVAMVIIKNLIEKMAIPIIIDLQILSPLRSFPNTDIYLN
jgi:hypothetical protein